MTDTSTWKRILLVCMTGLLLLILIILITVRGRTEFPEVTEIDISEESAALRDEMFGSYNIIGQTEEEQLRIFEEYSLPYLNSRTEQTFPNVATSNSLEKMEVKFDGCDVYTLSGKKKDCIVMYLHGGSWVWEITDLHVQFCDRLADILNAKVYIPIYPLAPQATYQETYRMIGEVYDELLKQHKPVIIMGDSAGGTIALGFVLSLMETGKKLPDKVVVMAPCADAALSSAEIDEYALKDGVLSRYGCVECAKLWAGGEDLKNPLLSPLYGNYEGFPDTLMFAEDCDILCPDDLKLFDRMWKAGVNVSLVFGNGFWHIYPLFEISEREQCLELIKEFCG